MASFLGQGAVVLHFSVPCLDQWKNWISSQFCFQNISIPRKTFPYHGIGQNCGYWIFQNFSTVVLEYSYAGEVQIFQWTQEHEMKSLCTAANTSEVTNYSMRFTNNAFLLKGLSRPLLLLFTSGDAMN